MFFFVLVLQSNIRLDHHEFLFSRPPFLISHCSLIVERLLCSVDLDLALGRGLLVDDDLFIELGEFIVIGFVLLLDVFEGSHIDMIINFITVEHIV